MKTAHDIAQALTAGMARKGVKMGLLVEKTGLTAVTLRSMLNGTGDPRLSSLLSLTQALGMELVIVPKEIAPSMAAPAGAQAPAITSLVAKAINRSA